MWKPLQSIKDWLCRCLSLSGFSACSSPTNTSPFSESTSTNDCDPLSTLFASLYSNELDALKVTEEVQPEEREETLVAEILSQADRLDLFVLRSPSAPAQARYMFGGQPGATLEEAHAKWMADL